MWLQPPRWRCSRASRSAPSHAAPPPAAIVLGPRALALAWLLFVPLIAESGIARRSSTRASTHPGLGRGTTASARTMVRAGAARREPRHRICVTLSGPQQVPVNAFHCCAWAVPRCCARGEPPAGALLHADRRLLAVASRPRGVTLLGLRPYGAPATDLFSLGLFVASLSGIFSRGSIGLTFRRLVGLADSPDLRVGPLLASACADRASGPSCRSLRSLHPRSEPAALRGSRWL